MRAVPRSIYTHNLLSKCGQTGFTELGLNPGLDSFALVEQNIAQGGPALLVYHGAPSAAVEKLLQGRTELWLLCVSADPVAVGPERTRRFKGRLYGLPWGWPDLRTDLHEDWKHLPKWQRECVRRFIENARMADVGQPKWELLLPPSVPEHVLACYLCALAGMAINPSWEEGFDQEVSAWGQQLSWDADRTDKERLLAFLRAAGSLPEGPRWGA